MPSAHIGAGAVAIVDNTLPKRGIPRSGFLMWAEHGRSNVIRWSTR